VRNWIPGVQPLREQRASAQISRPEHRAGAADVAAGQAVLAFVAFPRFLILRVTKAGMLVGLAS
jgi:hypothetical protein